jgi:hypothetical protein
MRNKSIYRGVLIAAGLLAAVIIILSHSASVNQVTVQKATSEKSDEKSDQKTTLQVPNAALTQGTAVQIDEQVPDTLIETISKKEEDRKFIPHAEKILTSFFRVLFNSIIAPNAP